MKKKIEIVGLLFSLVTLIGLIIKFIREKRKEGLEEIYGPEE